MSKQQDFDKLGLLDVEIDAVSCADAIDYICTLAADEESPACYVIKPYVEFLDQAYKNPKLQDLLNGAELSLADGVALTWAAAFLYSGKRTAGRFWLTLFQIVLAPGKLRWPIPDRGAGTNFTWPLLEEAGARDIRVFLIGKETPGDIAATAGIITTRLPKVKIVGTLSGREPGTAPGKLSPAWLERTQAALSAANPDLILVGMGFPLQEEICAKLAATLHHGVFIGEGGTFDYDSFGGPRRKAPRWMQRTGLEWLWRLILEPSRLIRQLAIPRFIYRIWNSR